MTHPPYQRLRCFFDSLIDSLPIAVRIGFLGPNSQASRYRSSAVTPRQNRTAEVCKQYLRVRHPDKLPQVEAFIANVESVVDDSMLSGWERLIDATNINDEMLWPLDVKFQSWLKRGSSAS